MCIHENLFFSETTKIPISHFISHLRPPALNSLFFKKQILEYRSIRQQSMLSHQDKDMDLGHFSHSDYKVMLQYFFLLSKFLCG